MTVTLRANMVDLKTENTRQAAQEQPRTNRRRLTRRQRQDRTDWTNCVFMWCQNKQNNTFLDWDTQTTTLTV